MQLLAGGHGSRPQLKPNTPTHHPTVVPTSSLSTTPNLGAALAGRKRGRSFDFDVDSAKRRRGGPSYSSRQSGEKQHNKGLRHFSQRVCEKVREKGATTYNEVRFIHVHVHVYNNAFMHLLYIHVHVHVYVFITHLIFRIHYFSVHKVWNNFPYLTSGYFLTNCTCVWKASNRID